jgi:uncharacterized protein (DUF2062 family)
MSASLSVGWGRAQVRAGLVRDAARRRVVAPLVALLRQGLSPEKLALSLGLGVAFGIFPVMGTTTLLCLAAGAVLRLNQPALQLVNYLVYPLQVPLILVFVRLGERLVGAAPVSFSVPALLAEFGRDPAAFVVKFGLTGLHGMLGWAAVAPLVAAALYFVTLPLLRRAAR